MAKFSAECSESMFRASSENFQEWQLDGTHCQRNRKNGKPNNTRSKQLKISLMRRFCQKSTDFKTTKNVGAEVASRKDLTMKHTLIRFSCILIFRQYSKSFIFFEKRQFT